MNFFILIVSFVILTLTIEQVMQIFFEKRRGPLPVLVVSYVLFFAAILSQLWLRHAVAVMYLYLLALIVISLNYYSPMKKRFFAVAGSYLVMYSFDVVYQFIAYIIGLHEVAYLIAMLLAFFVVRLVFRRMKNIKTITPGINKLLLPLLFIPVLRALSFGLLALNIPYVDEISNMAISVGVVFIIFYLYNNLANAFEENAKTAIHQREKEYYLAQCRLMQESSGRIRATRHDMKLHMVAINSLITENKTANAIEYINKFLVQIGESELYSNTGNLALDSIINYKLKDIAETKPNLRLNIPATIGIDDSDIVTIIGNLLDNSLEALANLNSQAEKTLTLNVALDKGTLLIKSENPYNGEIKENFATIKQGEEHGHGLKNIKRSVEKYDGYMKISHENNIFAVNILLYVKTPAQIQ